MKFRCFKQSLCVLLAVTLVFNQTACLHAANDEKRAEVVSFSKGHFAKAWGFIVRVMTVVMATDARFSCQAVLALSHITADALTLGMAPEVTRSWAVFQGSLLSGDSLGKAGAVFKEWPLDIQKIVCSKMNTKRWNWFHSYVLHQLLLDMEGVKIKAVPEQTTLNRLVYELYFEGKKRKVHFVVPAYPKAFFRVMDWQSLVMLRLQEETPYSEIMIGQAAFNLSDGKGRPLIPALVGLRIYELFVRLTGSLASPEKIHRLSSFSVSLKDMERSLSASWKAYKNKMALFRLSFFPYVSLPSFGFKSLRLFRFGRTAHRVVTGLVYGGLWVFDFVMTIASMFFRNILLGIAQGLSKIIVRGMGQAPGRTIDRLNSLHETVSLFAKLNFWDKQAPFQYPAALRERLLMKVRLPFEYDMAQENKEHEFFDVWILMIKKQLTRLSEKGEWKPYGMRRIQWDDDRKLFAFELVSAERVIPVQIGFSDDKRIYGNISSRLCPLAQIKPVRPRGDSVYRIFLQKPLVDIENTESLFYHQTLQIVLSRYLSLCVAHAESLSQGRTECDAGRVYEKTVSKNPERFTEEQYRTLLFLRFMLNQTAILGRGKESPFRVDLVNPSYDEFHNSFQVFLDLAPVTQLTQEERAAVNSNLLAFLDPDRTLLSLEDIFKKTEATAEHNRIFSQLVLWNMLCRSQVLDDFQKLNVELSQKAIRPRKVFPAMVSFLTALTKTFGMEQGQKAALCQKDDCWRTFLVDQLPLFLQTMLAVAVECGWPEDKVYEMVEGLKNIYLRSFESGFGCFRLKSWDSFMQALREKPGINPLMILMEKECVEEVVQKLSNGKKHVSPILLAKASEALMIKKAVRKSLGVKADGLNVVSVPGKYFIDGKADMGKIISFVLKKYFIKQQVSRVYFVGQSIDLLCPLNEKALSSWVFYLSVPAGVVEVFRAATETAELNDLIHQQIWEQ